jgi:hypothetical protein
MFWEPVDFGHKCNEVVASAARARPEVNALHHLLEKQQAGSLQVAVRYTKVPKTWRNAGSSWAWSQNSFSRSPSFNGIASGMKSTINSAWTSHKINDRCINLY